MSSIWSPCRVTTTRPGGASRNASSACRRATSKSRARSAAPARAAAPRCAELDPAGVRGRGEPPVRPVVPSRGDEVRARWLRHGEHAGQPPHGHPHVVGQLGHRPRGAAGRAREGRVVEAGQDPRQPPPLSPERLMDRVLRHGRIVSGYVKVMMRTVIVWWDRSGSTQTIGSLRGYLRAFGVEARVEGRYDDARLAMRGLASGD